MIRLKTGMPLLLALALLSGAPHTAQAAESYDNCTGFVTSLPAVISTQGTWCLKQDLATAITSGQAVQINTNNVTLDCNDFKLGGLAAGPGTAAVGVHSENRSNLTVRHCNIRGFYRGLMFEGTGGGHSVENNRFESNTYMSIVVEGDGSVIRSNRIVDTGGSSDAYAISTGYSVDIIDNTISGVIGNPAVDSRVVGINNTSNPDGTVSGNRIRGLLRGGAGLAYGIYNDASDRVTVRDNDVVGDSSAGSVGIFCPNANGRVRDNVINGFATGIDTCSNDGGNVIVP